ncbi:MAG: CinA family protein [Bacillota bacterium]
MRCHSDSFKAEEEIGRLLMEQRLTLGLAESCTGGLIASRITGVPGSSAYFAGCVVAYGNRVKEAVLNVSAHELAVFGAVSGEVARSMAGGAKKTLMTEIGLAVTGIAGPGGGTPEKPVGLVYIALDAPGFIITRELRLGGDRNEIRTATVESALEMLLKYLLESGGLGIGKGPGIRDY